MKTSNLMRCAVGALLFLSTLNPQLPSFAQGSLTPPGVPAPTMKSLAQIEPRTAITNTGSVAISQPGSYYLTTHLTVPTGDAIIINADNVTLDLNGFTVSSTAPSATGTGIALTSGRTAITILNGHIKGGVTNNAGIYSGSGFASGISYAGAPPLNVRVSGISVSGCQAYGIYLNNGAATVVEFCTVQTIGSYGILAGSVSHSAAFECGTRAIAGDTASDCHGYATGDGYGLDVDTANNCYGQTASGLGVYCSAANNCYGRATGSGDGVNGVTANNCYGESTTGRGVSATIANNCYGYANGSDDGLYAITAHNCYGYNAGNGHGLFAFSVAIGCYGFSATGTGLYAYIANSCEGSAPSGTAQNIVNKYNMP